MSETAGPAVPLNREVSLGVRLVGDPTDAGAPSLATLLVSLPSVLHIHQLPDDPTRLEIGVRSLAALLTELPRHAAPYGITLQWAPGADLILRLPEPAPPPSPLGPAATLPAARIGDGVAPDRVNGVAAEPGGHPGQAIDAPSLSVAPRRRRWSGAPWLIAAFSIVLATGSLGALFLCRSSSSGSDGHAEDSLPTERSPAAAVESPPLPAPVAVARSFASTCVTAGSRPCDTTTEALWRGDLAAWQARAAQRGQPSPDPAGAFQEAIRLRLEMGDPTTRIEIARGLNLPAVFLATLSVVPTSQGINVEVEIVNLGVAPADLGDARVVGARGETLFRLPASARLAPATGCRLSTRTGADSGCGFAAAAVTPPTIVDILPLTLDNRAGETLDTLAPSAGRR